MKTRKLYYEDSHLRSFSARVLSCEKTEKGFAVILDATAFYPEGGGQAADTGFLNGIRVLDTQEREETVVHLCEASLETGTAVEGVIDWEPRFHRMQQHSGEHIVSGIINRRYGYHNVGFHMGAGVVTIDFDGVIPQEALQEIENAVNAGIWADFSVKCWYPSEAELPTVPYRRKRDLPWPVRIVEFPDFDICACCGTQVQRTGEIGLVKLLSCVKFHEGVRIEMVCGKRALQLLSDAYEQNKQVSQAFSAKIGETGQAARRMNETLTAEKFRSAGLEKRLFAYIARGYAGQKTALHFEENLTPNGNRELCDKIADFATVAVTLSGTDENGYSICIISRTEDARAIGTEAAKALNGRGGGKKEAFQGNIKASRREIEAYFAR